ncbi:polymorphic toxin-type HINT domain-containing protein [Mastigocoleus sp. MO_188.B34]|uniref:polymorphic toxin-type HINT domain-containing protein n=1 Tax=Mastigocoleus sp. MO_188.B34 TaxID=3036635 RepID=UPI002610E62A|nr:polymorphic toxin-type HINT domain-containing protein [Mastigocoleus sp. MO_188.B34]MDJ0694549.1 polymorphic toxin-type HINT domain-containing protein [Mastigocoleus sp. MO_188.B34]
MKTAETKSTHSQQHNSTNTQQPFFNKEQEGAFFSEQSSEYKPFFSGADTSSFIQPKYASGDKPFFQPATVPLIQAKCAACEAEEGEQEKEQSAAETLDVQQIPAFESDENAVQAKMTPGTDSSKFQEIDRTIQQQANDAELDAPPTDDQDVQLWDCRKTKYEEPTCVQTQLDETEPVVQTKCAACAEEEQTQTKPAPPTRPSPGVIRREAVRGLKGAHQPLPHGSRIQTAFGRHDVSDVRTEVSGNAAGASRRMGALAFTAGSRIGFRESPSLHLAAHEAAHTVQQRAGLSLPNRVGRPGDRYERNADQVADAVVAGRSAEPLLDEVAQPDKPSNEGVKSSENSTLAAPAPAVQQQITLGASRLFEPPPAPIEVATSAPEGREAAPETAAVEAEPRERGEEGSALEAAEAGESEAPPEGVSTSGGTSAGEGAPPSAGGTPAAGAEPATPSTEAPTSTTEPATPSTEASAAGTSTSTAESETPAEASEGASGGGISGPCYNVDSPPPPENAEEPSSDERGSAPQEQPQVTFEPWPDEADECPAEQATAEGSERMPEGIGADSAASGVLAAGGAPAMAAGAEGGTPATATAAEGATPSGSREVQAMSRAATAGTDQSLAAANTMDGQIDSAEGERDATVNDYLASTGGFGDVLSRARSLESGVTFPAAEGLQQFKARQAAVEVAKGFMARASDQITAAVAFAQEQVPEMLRTAAESAKSSIQIAIETEKAAISERIAQARAQARAGAATARAHVETEYASSAVTIDAITLEAIAALDETHATSIEQVDEKETNGLDNVNSRFAAGRGQHEAKGPEYARQAIARGQQHAHAYEPCKGDYSDDGFWDGCLTVRRARAQQDTACKTAAGYKDTFLRTANKKGYDLIALRRQYRCAVIAGARRVNQTLDDTHEQLVSGLESGRMQALNGIALARNENLAAIDNAQASTLKALSAQEHSQRQGVNDTGYLKQLAVEQLAHSGAAGLAHGISAAMDSLEQTLTMLRERFAQGDIPDPVVLAQSLAATEASLGGGMGTLLDTMMEGAQQSATRIEEMGATSVEELADLTTQNDELSAQTESGFTQQMGRLKTGTSNTFAQLTDNHVQQAQQAMIDGTASMEQAVAGFDQALASIGGKVDEAIAKSLQELDKQLSDKLKELDGQITREALKAAEKEQPAWKSVVAIILIIVVIIAATVISIVTLGAGASLFAVILVGALVGAVSGGLIQLINNWASGEAWHTGLAQAMIMGAIGGAIGGGLGFAGGALAAGAAAAGARAATQLAITLTSDLVAEAATQAIGYVAFGQEFNWEGFVMAGAMSGVSFRAQGPRARGGASAVDVPTPRAAGGAGGRRAAVAQIAGGAALGFGIELAAAEISGKEFDLTKAVSSAASAAVSTRMARRGGPSGPAPEPTTRLGRAAERFRSFDPGGVGARLETGLQGLGGRAFGPRPSVEPRGGGQPRVDEPASSRVEESMAPRSRTTEETAPTTRSHPDEPDVGPRRTPADEPDFGPHRRRPKESSEPSTRSPEQERPGVRTRAEVDESALAPNVKKSAEQLTHAVCGRCFPAGTKVLTSSGYKNIEKIVAGDLVLARDDYGVGPVAVRQVLQTFQNVANTLLEISIDGQTICTTPGHLVWAAEKGWVFAAVLEAGDLLFTSDGLLKPISKIDRVDRQTDTFNLEVAELSTYFVAEKEGQAGIWVHNTSAARILEPSQVLAEAEPKVVITDPVEIERILGPEIRALGRHNPDKPEGGFLQYLRKGGGAGFLGVTVNVVDQLDTVVANVRTKEGGILTLVDLRLIEPGHVWDLSDPVTRGRMEDAYPRFRNMYQVMIEEGVVAIKGQLPTEAVQGLVSIPKRTSEVEIRQLAQHLLASCSV